MIQKIFEVKIVDVDYFDRFRATKPEPEVKHFVSLQEAWAFYKESKAKDFCWSNDHTRTTYFSMKFMFVPEEHIRHGYVRGYEYQYKDTDYIHKKYFSKPWFKKNYEVDKQWLSFYVQPAFTPTEQLCHRKIKTIPNDEVKIVSDTDDDLFIPFDDGDEDDTIFL